jgi:glucan 1,3-beta-glucosidase
MARLLSNLLIFSLACVGIANAWPYGTTPVRGVNLGSWLVLEKWMTPSVFAGLPGHIADEYQLCQYLGYVEAEKRLRAHWESWFKESDIIALKNAGINHIRIPIGYWALDIKQGEPWVSGSWDYVVRAAGWARTHGIQVMVDLHGAPGSQNGNDHSGQSGPIGFYYNDENLSRAVNVLGRIAQWANAPEWRDTVSLIQVLNEPVLWDDYNYRLQRLKDFTRSAYDEIRRHNDIVVIAVHDAFIDLTNWYYLRDDPHYFWVMLDTHLYQVFGDGWRDMSCDQHNYHPCSYLPRLTAANEKLWTVVGEWSLATPAELGCGNQALFARNQIGVFERASGWFMWSAKHEQGWNEWSFLDSVRLGWINLHNNPQPSC